VLELAHEQRQIQRAGHARGQSPALGRQRGHGLEQLLHPQRRGHPHPDDGRLVAGVGEPVVGARLDHHEITGAGGHRAQSLAEPHDPRADLEAFLLPGVDVPARHPPVRLDDRVELQQFAAGLIRGGVEDEPLTADRVDQNLPPKRHRDPLLTHPGSLLTPAGSGRA